MKTVKKILIILYKIFIGSVIELIKRLLILVKIAGWFRSSIAILLAVSIVYSVSIYGFIMFFLTGSNYYMALALGWIAMWAMPFPPAFLTITILSSIILFIIGWHKINDRYPNYNMHQFIFEMIRIDSVLSHKKDFEQTKTAEEKCS